MARASVEDRLTASLGQASYSRSSPRSIVGAGVPLFWIWIGSLIQSSRGAQNVEASTASILVVGILVSYIVILMIAGAIQGPRRGRPQRPPTRYPWNRSMRDEPYRPGAEQADPGRGGLRRHRDRRLDRDAGLVLRLRRLPAADLDAVFEAVHSERSTAAPAAIWELLGRPGAVAGLERADRARRDSTTSCGSAPSSESRSAAAARCASPGHRGSSRSVCFTDEARFPGARLAHEHRLAPGRSSAEVTHRLYLSGPLSGFWALMLGRKRMRESVVRFVERERELTEPKSRRRA